MKAFYKRIVATATAAAVILTSTLVLGAPKGVSAATGGEKHTHKICCETAHGDCAHENVEFEPFSFEFDSEDSQYILRGQNLYLTENIEMPEKSRLFVEKGVTNICLNGFSITKNGDEIIDINIIDGEDAVLNICDCRGGGSIKAIPGSKEEYFECIRVIDGSVLNIYGGTISGGSDTCGIYIHSSSKNPVQAAKGGTVNIYGGKVYSEDNCAVYSDGKNNTVTVYGGEVSSDTWYSICADKGNDTVTICGGNASQSIYNDAGSTLEIKGGNVSSESDSAIYNFGSLIISGGDISSVNDCAIRNYNGGESEINSGNVSSEQDYAILNFNGARLEISGGNISSAESYAIQNNNGAESEINGGIVSSPIRNSAGGTLKIKDGEVRSENKGRRSEVRAIFGSV